MTLLVIPARDLHPAVRALPGHGQLAGRVPVTTATRSPSTASSTPQRRGLPLATAARTRARPHARRRVRRDSTHRETRSAVEAGWRLLRLAGIEPHGFVAPAYAYTPALHQTLATRFRWWAGLLQVHRPAADEARARDLTPAWSLAGGGPVRGALSPALVRVGALTAGRTLRLDLHPSDLERPRHMLALEAVLRRAHDRRAVTYDELVAAGDDAS